MSRISRSAVGCVWATEGDVDDPTARHRFEEIVFRRLAERNVSIDMIDINPEGILFVVESSHIDAVRRELADLNVALKIRSQCTRVAVRFRSPTAAQRSLTSTLQALSAAGIAVYHCACRGYTISLVFDEDEEVRVGPVLRTFRPLASALAA